MLLENEKIKLRAIEPEDLDSFYKWENDTGTWLMGCTTAPYSRYQLKQYIASSKDIYESKQLRLMIEKKRINRVVGMIDLYDFEPFHRRAAIGIIIDGSYRQKGVAAEALTLLCEYAFSFLKLHQLYAFIQGGNEASVRLFKRCNFKMRGLLPDWVQNGDDYDNVLLFSLISHP
ncbi:MAG: GNAT family N-acetyltransferase [Tannerella sp.]|jgi:diamine N-acetyltransferase|nr:GNAT family N-acetyltransferase [Tannerella sp.]